MSDPVRLQLSRRKGFDLQLLSLATNGLPARSVARPGLFGNQWRVGTPNAPTAADAVRLFRQHDARRLVKHFGSELVGHNLACWCPLDQPCHADVLLELANANPPEHSHE